MSQVGKFLKKNLKKIIIVVAVAVIAYAAAPYVSSLLSGGAGSGGAAAASGGASAATAAGGGAGVAGLGTSVAGGATSAVAGAASSAAAGVTAAAPVASAGLWGSMSPIVKLGAIQAGTALVSGAMTEEPKSAAEQYKEMVEYKQTLPVAQHRYESTGGSNQIGAVAAPTPQQVELPAAQQQTVQQAPIVSPQQAAAPAPRVIGQYDHTTGKFV